MERRFSEHVTDGALKPFMCLKNLEREREWTSYVALCISGQAFQEIKELDDAGIEVTTVLGNSLEVPEGTFHEPFCGAIFSVEVSLLYGSCIYFHSLSTISNIYLKFILIGFEGSEKMPLGPS